MPKTKIVQFSDLHLSPRIPKTVTNWEYCLAKVDREKPELVVLSGDFVLDDPDQLDNQTFARKQIERLSAPWLLVPGNHDIGDSVEDPYQGQAITDARRDRFVALHGGDWWRKDVGGWSIIGINSMLPGSGLAAEAQQLSWLKQQVQSNERPIILFLHKPLCVDDLSEPANPAWAVPPFGRNSILDALAGAKLRIVASGHLHCHRHLSASEFDMVWAPTISIVSQTKVSGVSKTAGWIEYIVDGEHVTWQHKVAPELQAIDLTGLLGRYGALRFAPADALMTT